MRGKKTLKSAPTAQPVAKENAVQLIKAVRQRVKLLSENGSGFVAQPFNAYLKAIGIHHICAQRNHPQTNGKAERLNRTAKEKLTPIVHASPEEFDRALEAFRHGYNYEHYHEGIGNLHPADVYFGRAETILEKRKHLKEQTKKARKQANLDNPKKTTEETLLTSQGPLIT